MICISSAYTTKTVELGTDPNAPRTRFLMTSDEQEVYQYLKRKVMSRVSDARSDVM